MIGKPIPAEISQVQRSVAEVDKPISPLVNFGETPVPPGDLSPAEAVNEIFKSAVRKSAASEGTARATPEHDLRRARKVCELQSIIGHLEIEHSILKAENIANIFKSGMTQERRTITSKVYDYVQDIKTNEEHNAESSKSSSAKGKIQSHNSDPNYAPPSFSTKFEGGSKSVTRSGSSND